MGLDLAQKKTPPRMYPNDALSRIGWDGLVGGQGCIFFVIPIYSYL